MLGQKVFNDECAGIGTVTVRPFKIREDGGRDYFSVTKHNLIVEKGRGSLIDLLTGAKKKRLAYIRWGKGGALNFPDGDPLNPLPVGDKDTDVETFLLDKPLGVYKRKSPVEVEYVETLLCDEVDDDVNEAVMLFEEANTLTRSIFARITFPTTRLTITQGTGIELTWVFDFSRTEDVTTENQPIPEPEPDPEPDPPNFVDIIQDVIGDSTVRQSTFFLPDRSEGLFDNDTTTQWNGATNGGYPEQGFIVIVLPQAYTVTKYALAASFTENANQKMFKDWTIEAMNGSLATYENFEAYTVIDTVTNETNWSLGERREYSIDNPSSYNIYKITFTANNGFVNEYGNNENMASAWELSE
jgi:hypothetical protein